MRLSKTALGLLNNQYRSVLKKCFLINAGLFALSTTVNAAEIVVPSEPTRGANSAYSLVSDNANTTFPMTVYTLDEKNGSVVGGLEGGWGVVLEKTITKVIVDNLLITC